MTFVIPILVGGGFLGLFSSAMRNSGHDSAGYVSLIIFIGCITVAAILLLNLIGSAIG